MGNVDQTKVFLPPSLYDAALAKGYDMSPYVRTAPISQFAFSTDALAEIDSKLRRAGIGNVGEYNGVRFRDR